MPINRSLVNNSKGHNTKCTKKQNQKKPKKALFLLKNSGLGVDSGG